MKYSKILFAIIIISFANNFYVTAQSCPKWVPYVGAKQMPGDADLMMADVMIPAEGNMPYTYTCAIQFSLGKSGGYCGLQNNNGKNKNEKRPYNNIFSVWDYPNKIQIVHTYKAPMTFVGGFGNEGTGLHSHCDFGWNANQWYTNVVRRWYDGGDKTYVAYFIYDHEKKEWTHYVTFAVPEANAMLHGDISSFLENFGDETKSSRSSYYKSYWKLTTDNKWINPKFFEADAGEGNWHAEAYGNDGIKLTACGKDKINGKKISAPVTSNDVAPSIISAAEIYDMGAYYSKQENKIYVNWSIKKSAAPQLSYEINLFDDSTKTSKPLASVSGFGPEIREAIVTTKTLNLENKNYYIVLKLKDIFNQNAAPKEFVLSELKP
ncbi:MAG: DUF3472 domain-containing protein [Chitinophagaceae bacterium]